MFSQTNGGKKFTAAQKKQLSAIAVLHVYVYVMFGLSLTPSHSQI